MRSMTFDHVLPGRYVPTASMPAGGASLEWVIDVLAPGQDDRYAARLGEAAEVQAGEDGVSFLSHLLGERSPYRNPAARAVFVGLGPGDPAQPGRRCHGSRARRSASAWIFDVVGVAGRFSRQLTSQSPDPVRNQRYGREYALFTEAYARLEPWFDKP